MLDEAASRQIRTSIANSTILTRDGQAEEPEQEEKLRLSPALNPGC